MDGRNKIKKTKDVDHYVDEAISNIRHDRAVVKSLLTDLLVHLKTSQEDHRDSGVVAAKYVETLQRSNEQLVKLAALLSKKESTSSVLTDSDKSELFDLIKEVK
jgi:septal ring factor EnvC (AmiA/AmiB activator)